MIAHQDWEHYDPERVYFKEALKYYEEHIKNVDPNYMFGIPMWSHIKFMVYAKFRVRQLKHMKPEWKNEANKFAIKVMKLIEVCKEDGKWTFKE